MDAFIKSDLESLKDEQLRNIFKNLNLINIAIPERQEMIDTIYNFLQNHTQSNKNIKEIDDKDIIDCWQDYMISLLSTLKSKDDDLKNQKNLILAEIAKIHSVSEVSDQLEAIARNILLLVFQSLGDKQKDKLIKKLKEETAVKYHLKLGDYILNKALVEAILNATIPVALGASLPIVCGLLLNYLSKIFLIDVALTVLGWFGTDLAEFKEILALMAGFIGWGIAGSVSLGAILLAGSKFFKKRNEILFIMTILFIYTSRYQIRMPVGVAS